MVAFLEVDPNQQGKGLGSKLLKVALGRADAARYVHCPAAVDIPGGHQ